MKLDGLLKTVEVTLETTGETVTIHELSYGAQMAVHKSTIAEDGLAGAINVKHALKLEESLEEIADKVPLRVVQEISDHLGKIMEIDAEETEKN